MWRFLTSTFSILVCSLSSTAFAQTPYGVHVDNISAVGSGCPAGTYSATISPDGQAFSLLLDQFFAESTMQNPIARLMCELKVNFRVPAGWTFAVLSADYRGFAYAEAGTVAVHQALYSFDGSRPRNERPGYQDGGSYSFRMQEFHGPYNNNYSIRHELDPRIAPWAPCRNESTQTLFLTTFLMARNLNLSSLITSQISLDSIDGHAQSQQYRLAWKRCQPTVGPQPPPVDPRNPRPNPRPGRPPRYPGPGRG